MFYIRSTTTAQGVTKHAENLNRRRAFVKWLRIVYRVRMARKSGAEIEATRTAAGYVATIKKPGQVDRYTLTR